jgi:hypothetical protein
MPICRHVAFAPPTAHRPSCRDLSAPPTGSLVPCYRNWGDWEHTPPLSNYVSAPRLCVVRPWESLTVRLPAQQGSLWGPNTFVATVTSLGFPVGGLRAVGSQPYGHSVQCEGACVCVCVCVCASCLPACSRPTLTACARGAWSTPPLCGPSACASVWAFLHAPVLAVWACGGMRLWFAWDCGVCGLAAERAPTMSLAPLRPRRAVPCRAVAVDLEFLPAYSTTNVTCRMGAFSIPPGNAFTGYKLEFTITLSGLEHPTSPRARRAQGEYSTEVFMAPSMFAVDTRYYQPVRGVAKDQLRCVGAPVCDGKAGVGRPDRQAACATRRSAAQVCVRAHTHTP